MSAARSSTVVGLLCFALALPAAAQQRPPAESGFGGFLTVMPGVQ